MKNSVSIKVSAFLFLLILFPTLVFANWVAETPLSTPRDQFTGGVINGKIYVFGGNGNPNGVNLKSTEMFDPATQSWTYQANNENNNGFGVEELTGTVVNGKLYVFGAYGEGYPPYGVFNFVEEYDPITNTWTSKASMPTTRTGGAAAVYNGEIYVFGGSSAGPDPRPVTDVVEAYDPATNTWRFVTNMPKVVVNPAIAVVGDKAYVIGGYFLDEDRMLEDVIVYDFQTGTWITTGFTPLPTPRAFPYSHALPVVDGKIYLVGGVMGTLASSWTPLDVVEIYDTITDTWGTGPLLPQPTDHYLTVLLNRTIYVIGGITEDGTRTGAVWKLNNVGWKTAYNILFDNPSHLALLRQYRNEFLTKTTKGKLYTDLLYKASEEALEVLLSDPELLLQAKDLIDANKDAVSEVLNGNEGVIYNTDEIISFLDAYADKSPPALKILANMVKSDMLRKQSQGKLFLGFELRQ